MPPVDRTTAGLRSQLLRQLNHWKGAAERLDDFEASAPPDAWGTLERYVGVALRAGLKTAREQLNREAEAVRAAFYAARFRPDLERVAEQVATLRRRYLQTELLVDFYVAAVRARSNPELALQLRACDVMADRVIRGPLEALGMKAPPVMTYFTTGVGASIMRIGTRLWDGSLSPIAAIRLTYHNRFRNTSLFHECGHQVAGITGWNEEFARLLRIQLAPAGSEVADTAAGWASEIAADAYAFAWTGYASVVALSDVVAGQGAEVFRFLMGDPHPISYLRVMLGVEMCRRFYGMGPWDDLASAWQELYPLSQAPPVAASVIAPLLPLLPRIVDASLRARMQCFRGKTLIELADPQRAAPAALREMERKAGGAIFTSTHWMWTECVRLTALTGLRYATEPEKGPDILKQQEQWMVRLGEATQAAA
ncbi:MAG: hypothetical protein JWN34_5132 [Bryobacterales bacterium]|nr:hypothetical protein [Bryobacterales bacterium]